MVSPLVNPARSQVTLDSEFSLQTAAVLLPPIPETELGTLGTDLTAPGQTHSALTLLVDLILFFTNQFCFYFLSL